MKTMLKPWFAGVMASLCLGVWSARADLEVSASIQIHSRADFYDPLAAHGGWIEVGSYGRCWHPAHVAVDWRPYCVGHWVYTDCGWYWDSDEPWAWACYHYGSWVDDPVNGWIWVPDVEWAPAWVVWRSGGGYVGWAPCAPRGVSVGITVGAPAVPFVFVQESHFHDPVRPATVIVNNQTVINKTTVINTSIRQETRVVDGGSRRVNVNTGPSVAEIQSATGKQVRPVAVRQAVTQTPAPSHITPRKEFPAAPPAEHGLQKPIEPNRNQTRPDNGREPVRTPAPTPTQPQKPSEPFRDQPRPEPGPKPQTQTPPKFNEPAHNNQPPARTEPGGEPVRTPAPAPAQPQKPTEPFRDQPRSESGHENVRTPAPQPAPTKPAPPEREPAPAQKHEQPAAPPHQQAPQHEVRPTPPPATPHEAPPRQPPQERPQHEEKHNPKDGD